MTRKTTDNIHLNKIRLWMAGNYHYNLRAYSIYSETMIHIHIQVGIGIYVLDNYDNQAELLALNSFAVVTRGNDHDDNCV